MFSPKLLFTRLSEGDENAFREIFDHYKERLLYVAVKMLRMNAVAEEVVQDVFVSVWKNQSKFTTIHDPEAYLFAITYNRIYKQLKKIAADQKMTDEWVRSFHHPAAVTDDRIIYNEEQSLIYSAIESLSPQRKKIFKLSRFEGMTHEEIASRLKISRHSVRNQIVEAVKQLRNYLRTNATLFILFFIR